MLFMESGGDLLFRAVGSGVPSAQGLANEAQKRSAGRKQIFRAARNRAEDVAALRRSLVTQQHGKDAAACAMRCAE